MNQGSAAPAVTMLTSWPDTDNSWTVLFRNDSGATRSFVIAAWATCANVQ